MERWLNRDPIGTDGGLNIYGYANQNPLRYIDPYGLSKFDKLYGLPKKFWQWYHRNEKRQGDPDLGPDDARDLHKEWKDKGSPGPDQKRNQRDQGGYVDPSLLEWLIPWYLLPTTMGCAELDCDGNGIPDHEEKNCQ